eukprot:1195294-Prorocentrum_minimum.AAC.1
MGSGYTRVPFGLVVRPGVPIAERFRARIMGCRHGAHVRVRTSWGHVHIKPMGAWDGDRQQLLVTSV